MRLLCLPVLVLSCTAFAVDFPPVEKLPARPELPDPLTTFSGEKITTKEDWFAKRKPELRALFEHYMYGKAPEPPKLDFKVVREDKNYFGGAATKKEIELRIVDRPKAPVLTILLVIPNKRTRPAPVFAGLNFTGNHTVVKDPGVALNPNWMYAKKTGVVDNKSTEESRGTAIDTWCLEDSIARGYAVATVYSGDIDPDKHDWTDGVHAAYYKEGQTQPGQHEWGTIAAWAWGMQRIVDYLVTDSDIDKTKIIAMGHSRLGKTALLTAAFDDRIAMSIPIQAGCGGTAPSRGKIGEPVTRINTVFPHWFGDEFPKFNDKTELLPFDQHCLLAMCAPRPVLFANAQEDTWANPDGQFDVLKAAEPVYKLVGASGCAAEKVPELNKLVDSTLGYFIRPGKHEVKKDDWQAFWDFADKHFGKPQ